MIVFRPNWTIVESERFDRNRGLREEQQNTSGLPHNITAAIHFHCCRPGSVFASQFASENCVPCVECNWLACAPVCDHPELHEMVGTLPAAYNVFEYISLFTGNSATKQDWWCSTASNIYIWCSRRIRFAPAIRVAFSATVWWRRFRFPAWWCIRCKVFVNGVVWIYAINIFF